MRSCSAMGCLAGCLIVWLSVAATAAAEGPPNDDFDQATVVNSLPFTDTLDVSAATTAFDEPVDLRCAPFGEFTVWYRFTPAQNSRVVANTYGSGPNTALSVFTGDRDALSLVACDDNSAHGFNAQVVVYLTAGVTYHFLVGSTGASILPNVTFSLSVAPPAPPNDDFDAAATISQLPFRGLSDTTFASASADDPTCSFFSPTVWFTFTPARQVRVDVSTGGSDYATTLSVYTGARGSLNTLSCVTEEFGAPARVRFLARSGVTYHIMVGASGLDTGGHLRLNVTRSGAPVRIATGR